MIAALILAAGESRRMGSPKALLDFRGETFLDHVVSGFSRFCAPVIVVLGHGAEEIRQAVRSAKGEAVFVVNTNYQVGQLSSMQCGLRAVPDDAGRVLFTLVDHPAVLLATIQKLVASSAPVAMPRYQGRRGHPVLFSAALIPEFLELPADAQARTVMVRHADETEYVDVDDPGILQDIDDPAAYRQLMETS